MLRVFHQLNRNVLAADRNEVTETSESHVPPNEVIHFSESGDLPLVLTYTQGEKHLLCTYLQG